MHHAITEKQWCRLRARRDNSNLLRGLIGTHIWTKSASEQVRRRYGTWGKWATEGNDFQLWYVSLTPCNGWRSYRKAESLALVSYLVFSYDLYFAGANPLPFIIDQEFFYYSNAIKDRYTFIVAVAEVPWAMDQFLYVFCLRLQRDLEY